jgi:luciferase family oxidoreductase group 1
MALPLSVLDLSPISAGIGGAQALRNTLDLARLTDRLGYRRYWLAEHHNIPSVASTAPAVMIAHVASATTRMRVGSGGIMLPNHAPLHVAETFRVLEALHPGRIDLGVGRAPGSDQLTALALRRSAPGGRFNPSDLGAQIAELRGFAGGGFPANNPFSDVQALPEDVPLPPVWILGSSDYGAQLAAELGLGFAFAHHFSPAMTDVATRLYRKNFRTSGSLKRRHLILTVSVVCAPTDAEAERLAASLDLVGIRRAAGHYVPIPSPDEALAYPFSAWEHQQALSYRSQHIIGTPERVKDEIHALAGATGADEIMVTTTTHGHAERRRSYELLADLFGLAGAP